MEKDNLVLHDDKWISKVRSNFIINFVHYMHTLTLDEIIAFKEELPIIFKEELSLFIGMLCFETRTKDTN